MKQQSNTLARLQEYMRRYCARPRSDRRHDVALHFLIGELDTLRLRVADLEDAHKALREEADELERRYEALLNDVDELKFDVGQ